MLKEPHITIEAFILLWVDIVLDDCTLETIHPNSPRLR